MALRTVGVRLKAEVADYVNSLKAADKTTKGLTDELHDAARAGKDFGASSSIASAKAAAGFKAAGAAADDLGDEARQAAREIDKLGDEARQAAREIDKLGDEIRETERRVKSLADEIRRVGPDADLVKKFGAEEAQLAKLRRVHRALEDITETTARAAKTSGGLFGGVTGAFGPQGRTAIIGGLVAAGLAAAPPIGAAITGAIGGAAGSAAIAAGIASAARSSEVKSAWSALALEGAVAFSDFGKPFIQPTVEAITTLRNTLALVRGDLDAIAADASRFVGPLSRGVAGFSRETVAGLRDLIDAADPVFDMFEDELPRVGRSVRSFFRSLGNGAEGGADALRALFRLIEVALPVIGAQLEIWAGQIELLADASQKLAIFAGPMAFFFENTGDKAIKGKGGVDSFNFGLDETEDAARTAADRIKELNDRFDTLFDRQMNLDQANVDFQLGLIDLGDTLKDNNENIDDANELWLANQDALLGMIDKADGARDAAIDIGNGTEEASRKANGAYDTQLEQIRKVALALGLPISKVNELIERYKALHFMPNIVKTVRFVAENERVFSRPGVVIAQAKGGIVAAQQGMITSSPTVLFGERPTVREAFIPQQGISDQRALAIGAEAMRWHKASVVPWEQMGAALSAAMREANRPAGIDQAALAGALRSALRGVSVRLDGRAVGEIEARRADLYARGG